MKNHMIDHRSYTHNINSCEIKPEKNSGLNGIRTYDFFPFPFPLFSTLIAPLLMG